MPDHDVIQEGVLSTRSKRGLLVLLTVAAIVLMMIGAEGVVRLRQMLKYGSATATGEYYTVDRAIDLRVPVPNFSNGRVSINSLGFRGPELELPKPRNTVRLAFLGASTTWCAEVSGNDLTWPHLVSQSLNRTFAVHFDYVNGSLPGYTIASLLKNLKYRVAPLKPDVIVIYEAANNLSGELRELAAKQGIIHEEKIQEFSWPGRYSVLWNLVEKNLRVLYAQRAAQANQGRLVVTASQLGREYRQELLELVLAARKTASLVAVATFSIHPRRGQNPENQMRALSSALFYTPFVTPTTIIEAYERYNQIAREVAEETGAYLIGGADDIPGDPVHFADTVHFTDEGSKAMAERVSRSLASSPLLRQLAQQRGGH
jgi:lysophospholipase L1-like esterase